MAMTTAPGVSAQLTDATLFSIQTGETSIPVFIGKFAYKGGTPTVPENLCISVESWFDFREQFATPTAATVSVVRDTSRAKNTGSSAISADASDTVTELNVDVDTSWRCVQLYFDNGGGRCYVLNVDLATPSSLAKVAGVIAGYPDITLLCAAVDIAEAAKVYDALSSLLNKLGSPFLVADSLDGTSRPSTDEKHTAVYYPGLRTTYSLRPANDEIIISGLAEPISLAELKTDPNEEALYAQIAEKVDTWVAENPLNLPASPAVVAHICKSDAEHGPGRSHAGRAFFNVLDRDILVPAEIERNLQSLGINTVKWFGNEGVKCWGTRTMVSAAEPAWLYIPVARLFDAMARDIQGSLRVAVFKPNISTTWEAVASSIKAYLDPLQRDGKIAEFEVWVGLGVTMTQADVLAGRMIVQVKVKPNRPAEFISLTFTQLLLEA